MTKFHDNIISWFDAATPGEVQAGKEWYRDVNFFVKEQFAPHQAVLASLAIASPQQDWGRVKSAVYAYWRDEDYSLPGILGHAKEKIRAIRVADDTWPNYVKGLKTRAFCDNLQAPDTSLAVTIDRHAVCIPMVAHDPATASTVIKGKALAEWWKQRLGKVNLANPAHYERFAGYYREVAQDLNLMPSQVQAVTWVAWRRIT
jgi:hypothetical protein